MKNYNGFLVFFVILQKNILLSQTYHIKKSSKNHRVTRPTQTGFSSPATHYSEPRIDLNDALVSNSSSTFFVRVIDNVFSDYDITKNDVLIIDKSLTPKKDQLVLANEDGSFLVKKIEDTIKNELQIWGVITYIIKSTL
ncbi:S24 family peptidase [Lacinutrix salivirga]